MSDQMRNEIESTESAEEPDEQPQSCYGEDRDLQAAATEVRRNFLIQVQAIQAVTRRVRV